MSTGAHAMAKKDRLGKRHEDMEVKESVDQVDELDSFAETKYLTPEEAEFRITSGGVLSLKLGDTEYPKVDLYLAFPFSLEEQFISVRDPEGEEIGMIRNLQDFTGESREALLKELQWRYYAPQIKRVLNIKDEFGYFYWDVETDRGLRRFVTRGRDDSINLITDTRLLIIDMTGNRFEIPNIEMLDARSVRLIEALI